MISLNEILDYARAAAIADALDSTEEANYRYICRQYSKTYHTPLQQVYELDFEEVARAFFESQLDGRDLEKDLEGLLDVIYEIEDPDYIAEKRKDLDDFIEQAEEEERQRVAKKKAIHPGIAKEEQVTLKNTPEIPSKEGFENPTGGSVNLSYLADSENEG